MVEKPESGTNWETFVKLLLNRLEIPTKEDINSLHQRLDTLEQMLYQKHAGPAKSRKRTPQKRKNASSIVLDVIANHPEGTNFKTIKAATGFDDKKIRNIIFRLEKINKIQRVRRGIYKSV